MRHERAKKCLISGMRAGESEECQDQTGEGQKVLYPDEGRRELKNVRTRHERATKPYIRMRAWERVKECKDET